MAYSVESKKSGTTYYLHARETESRGGKRRLFFFAKEQKEGVLDALPEGYTVTESAQTGLPLLKRADAETSAKPEKAKTETAEKPKAAKSAAKK